MHAFYADHTGAKMHFTYASHIFRKMSTLFTFPSNKFLYHWIGRTTNQAIVSKQTRNSIYSRALRTHTPRAHIPNATKLLPVEKETYTRTDSKTSPSSSSSLKHNEKNKKNKIADLLLINYLRYAHIYIYIACAHCVCVCVYPNKHTIHTI